MLIYFKIVIICLNGIELGLNETIKFLPQAMLLIT